MSDTLEGAVVGQDIVFIAVSHPMTQYDGKAPSMVINKDFDYTLPKQVLSEVNAVATKDPISSPRSIGFTGTTRREFIDLIQTLDLFTIHFIAMGTVKWDMVNPEMVMIGTEDGSETGDAKELVDHTKQ